MKKNILLTLFIIFSILNINSQDKTNTKKIITSGKWYIEYMQFGNDKKVLPEKLKNNNWMLFNQNGKVQITTQGVESIEKWNYVEKKEIINITEDGKFAEFKIKTLNESEFIIYKIHLKKTTILGMKK